MTNMNRQPAGAPAHTGGQFASGTHDEAQSSLTPDSFPRLARDTPTWVGAAPFRENHPSLVDLSVSKDSSGNLYVTSAYETMSHSYSDVGAEIITGIVSAEYDGNYSGHTGNLVFFDTPMTDLGGQESSIEDSLRHNERFESDLADGTFDARIIRALERNTVKSDEKTDLNEVFDSIERTLPLTAADARALAGMLGRNPRFTEALSAFGRTGTGSVRSMLKELDRTSNPANDERVNTANLALTGWLLEIEEGH